MTAKEFKQKNGLTYKELNELVIGEATKLKTNAKKSELAKLDFSNLNTKHVHNCIYGQMTGNCFNNRATTLIKQSCERIFEAKYETDIIEGKLNGSPKELKRDKFWSPIEIFIDQPRNKENGNNERLVKFLKGETKELTLK